MTNKGYYHEDPWLDFIVEGAVYIVFEVYKLSHTLSIGYSCM